MTWVRLDDRFPWHPKAIGLTDRAFRLYVSALCYCAGHDTDGELSPAALRVLGARQKELDELVHARLLDRDENGATWIHDYLEYHPTRAQVKARRDAVAKRVRNHRVRGQRNTVTEDPPGSVSNTVTPAQRNAVTNADVTGDEGGISSRARAGRDPTDPLLDRESRENGIGQDPDQVSPTYQVREAKKAADPPGVRQVFEHWQTEHRKPRAKLDPKRKARIAARLRDGFTSDQLCLAISNAKNDRFLMGENEHGRVYDDIQTLLRDAAQVERLEALTERPSGTQRAAAKPPGAIEHESRTGRPPDSPPLFRREPGELKPIGADVAAMAQRAAAAARGDHG